jgi:hypothetical protein
MSMTEHDTTATEPAADAPRSYGGDIAGLREAATESVTVAKTRKRSPSPTIVSNGAGKS